MLNSGKKLLSNRVEALARTSITNCKANMDKDMRTEINRISIIFFFQSLNPEKKKKKIK